jgi:hypothetical protein
LWYNYIYFKEKQIKLLSDYEIRWKMRRRELISISCEEGWINQCLPGQYLADTTM